MNSWRISYTGRNRGLAVALLAALVLLAGILYLLFRKGYQGEGHARQLTSVAAAAAK